MQLKESEYKEIIEIKLDEAELGVIISSLAIFGGNPGLMKKLKEKFRELRRYKYHDKESGNIKGLKTSEKDVIVNKEELEEIYIQFLEDFNRLDDFIHKRIMEAVPEKFSGGMASSFYDDTMKKKKE